MPQRANLGFVLFSTFALLVVAVGPTRAQELPQPMCRLMIDEENMELLDARIAVSLARSAFATYEEIFVLIEKLWKADAIQRMKYIKAKYDRDAAKLALEQADLILKRQEILLEQYGMICARPGSADSKREHARRLDAAYVRYRAADCDSIAKEIEIAETKLKFDREWLKSILDLRTGEVATKVDVLLAQLEVEQEEKRLDDAKRRTEGCRQDLASLKGEAEAP